MAADAPAIGVTRGRLRRPLPRPEDQLRPLRPEVLLSPPRSSASRSRSSVVQAAARPSFLGPPTRAFRSVLASVAADRGERHKSREIDSYIIREPSPCPSFWATLPGASGRATASATRCACYWRRCRRSVTTDRGRKREQRPLHHVRLGVRRLRASRDAPLAQRPSVSNTVNTRATLRGLGDVQRSLNVSEVDPGPVWTVTDPPPERCRRRREKGHLPRALLDLIPDV